MPVFRYTASMATEKAADMLLPFSGRKALVIGGTGGIGRALALALAEKGADVTVHGGSSRRRLDDTIGALRAAGGKGEGFLFPIHGPDAAADILALFSPEGDPAPDILVCAWGPFRRGSWEMLGREFWQSMAESNLVFPGMLVSMAIPGMIQRNWGRILLFGGTNTDIIRGYHTTTAYSACKTALGVIAKSAAKTAGSRGVTCNVLCPGLTDTEYTSEEQQRYHREKCPGGKPLDAEQVARAALAILENPGFNGAVVPVDQGVIL